MGEADLITELFRYNCVECFVERGRPVARALAPPPAFGELARKKETALAEHVARHPEDGGLTVEGL